MRPKYSILVVAFFITLMAMSSNAQAQRTLGFSNLTLDVGQATNLSITVPVASGNRYYGQWSFFQSSLNHVSGNVVDSFDVGSYPSAIAFSPSGSIAYVIIYNNSGMVENLPGSINVINISTGRILASVSANIAPYAIALNRAGTVAYVSGGNGTLTVFNAITYKVVNTIYVRNDSFAGIALNPSGSMLYVTNNTDPGVESGNQAYVPDNPSSVEVIDTNTDSVVNTIQVGTFPDSIAFNPSGSEAYVTNYYSGTVSVINTTENKVVGDIRISPPITSHIGNSTNGPIGVVFDPSAALAYVTNKNGTISVVDTLTETVVNTIDVEHNPSGLAFNPSGTMAYVTNQQNGTINMIYVHANEIVRTISVGTLPLSISFNPSGTEAYVVNYYSGNVSVIGNLQQTALTSLMPDGLTKEIMELTVKPISSNTILFGEGNTSFTRRVGLNNTIYGQWQIYGFASEDYGNAQEYANNSLLLTTPVPIVINPAPSISIKSNASQIAPGENFSLEIAISGGTGPFTVSLYNITGAKAQGNVPIIVNTNGNKTISLTAGTEEGAFSYNAIAVDMGTTSPLRINSSAVTVEVVQATAKQLQLQYVAYVVAALVVLIAAWSLIRRKRKSS